MKVEKYFSFKTLPKKVYYKVSEVLQVRLNKIRKGKLVLYCISLSIKGGKHLIVKFKTIGEYRIEISNLIKNNIPFGNDKEVDHTKMGGLVLDKL